MKFNTPGTTPWTPGLSPLPSSLASNSSPLMNDYLSREEFQKQLHHLGSAIISDICDQSPDMANLTPSTATLTGCSLESEHDLSSLLARLGHHDSSNNMGAEEEDEYMAQPLQPLPQVTVEKAPSGEGSVPSLPSSRPSSPKNRNLVITPQPHRRQTFANHKDTRSTMNTMIPQTHPNPMQQQQQQQQHPQVAMMQQNTMVTPTQYVQQVPQVVYVVSPPQPQQYVQMVQAPQPMMMVQGPQGPQYVVPINTHQGGQVLLGAPQAPVMMTAPRMGNVYQRQYAVSTGPSAQPRIIVVQQPVHPSQMAMSQMQQPPPPSE
eukprot:PhF_6_TR26406/c0_g1_i1/m.38161